MIEIEHLSWQVAGQHVLDDVNLTIEDAEVFALIGRSGAGKSVLLKHITGLQKPDSGRILVDEVDLAELDPAELQQLRRRFGVLFQNGALFDYMSVFENTAFPLRMLTNRSESEIAQRVSECLEMVEMQDSTAKMPAALSGGEMKRVALARAIILEPEYLFYDEPTTGLDPETSNTIEDLLARLARDLSVTSIVVTHDMHSVFAIADRVGFLNDGGMQFVGSVEEMRRCADVELCEFIRANEYHV